MSAAKWGPVLALASLLCLVAGMARPAFADVTGNASLEWSLAVYTFAPASGGENVLPPAGLAISCFGGATGGGGGCSDSFVAGASADVSGSGVYSESRTSGFQLTNTSDQAIDGSLFLTGGVGTDGISIWVDDPATEYASFWIRQVMPAALDDGIDHEQGCAIGLGAPDEGCDSPDAFHAYITQDSDYVQGYVPIALEPGASMEIPFTQTITFSFALSDPVPEPGSLPLLASGLLFGSIALVPRRRWVAAITRGLWRRFAN